LPISTYIICNRESTVPVINNGIIRESTVPVINNGIIRLITREDSRVISSATINNIIALTPGDFIISPIARESIVKI